MKLPEGTIIGHTECSGCGAEKALKINGKGNVYYFCADVIGRDENGKPEQCFTRFNMGRTGSKKLIDEYLANQKGENNVAESEIPQSENRNSGDSGTDSGGDDRGKSDERNAGLFGNLFS